MANDRLHPRRPDTPDMSADMIAGRRFGQSWRGYDTDEVTRFLAQVALQVRALRERYDQAESARREAEQRAAHPEIDEVMLMSAVGEETANILRSARSAAAEITAKAQANAQAILATAENQAAEMVAQGESLLAARSAEAELVATQIRDQADAEAQRTRELAQQQANELADQTTQKCAESIQAAQAVREKILTDLARRRKLGTVQVEQLRAGRERLLDAYLVVRRTLDEVTDELQRADAEARAASQGAGRQHTLDPDELLDLRGQDAWGTAVPPAEAKGTAQLGVSEEPTSPAMIVPKFTPSTVAGPISAEKLPTPTQAGPAPAGATEVVSRADAIESVRILRHEPPAPTATAGEGSTTVTDDPGSTAQDDVQGLFARIRASRAEATDSARKALRDGDPGPVNGAGPGGMAPGEPTAAASDAAAEVGGHADASDQPAAAAVPTPDLSAIEDYFARREKVTDRLESSLARKLKRALQDEQNALLDRLRNLKGRATAADVLPNIEEQPDRFVDAGRSVLAETAQAGSDLVARLFTGASPAPRLGPEVVDSLAEELGRAITEPLRQRLEQALGSSNDPADLAEALGPAYREWKTQRIEAAARDQVAAAFARGAYMAFPEHAILRWVASPSPGPCPDCEDNALAGDQPKGDSWPTGQLHPPAHPGCRCALAPPGADGPIATAVGSSAGTSSH